MQVRMSEEEVKLVHELVQDALIDEVQMSKELEGGVAVRQVREVLLERLEKKLRQ